MARLFPLTSSGGQRATRKRSKRLAEGTFRDEIIAPVTRLEFYRPCPLAGSVRLPRRTEWQRAERGRLGHTPLIRNTSRAGPRDKPTGVSAALANGLRARRGDTQDLFMRCRSTSLSSTCADVNVQSVTRGKWTKHGVPWRCTRSTESRGRETYVHALVECFSSFIILWLHLLAVSTP